MPSLEESWKRMTADLWSRDRLSLLMRFCVPAADQICRGKDTDALPHTPAKRPSAAHCGTGSFIMKKLYLPERGAAKHHFSNQHLGSTKCSSLSPILSSAFLYPVLFSPSTSNPQTHWVRRVTELHHYPACIRKPKVSAPASSSSLVFSHLPVYKPTQLPFLTPVALRSVFTRIFSTQ